MKTSGIIKIILALVVLLIVGGLVYYFMFSPSAKYKKIVGNADELFAQNRLDDAKDLYNKAFQLNKAETYPKRQVKIIDSLTHQIKLQIMYDEKIQKADGLFESKEYREASKYYFEAANLMPDADYPVEQIQLSQKLSGDPSYVKPVQKPVVQSTSENKPKTAITNRAANQNQNTLADGKYYHVVVGVFSNHQNAAGLNEKLIGEGRDSRIIYRPGKPEVVTFGSYKDFNTAASFLEFVKNDINKNAWVLHFEE